MTIDPPEALERKQRQVALVGNVGRAAFFAAHPLAATFELFAETSIFRGVLIVACVASVIVAGIIVLVWDSMSRRLKKRMDGR
jgi:hypothetical protein